MHILLTDVLTCPRCGPGFGLIVLADRMDDRRVVQGRLGCANCRSAYPVEQGVADLRRHPAADGSDADPVAGDERAYRTAALLGVGGGPGLVLVSGGAAELVDEVARLLPNAQVVGMGRAGGEAPASRASWLRAEGPLPVRDRALRAVALLGGAPPELLGDLPRAVAPGGHVVIDPAGPETARILEERGFQLLLEQEGVVVASAPPPA